MKKKLTKVIDSPPMSGFMHQSIPGAPRQQQRIVSPGGGGWHILGGPGVGYLQNPGPSPSLWLVHASLSKHN